MVPITSVELWWFLGIAWIPRIWNSWSWGGFWELLAFPRSGILGVVPFGNVFDSQDLEILQLWCFQGIACISKVWNSWSCGIWGELLGFPRSGIPGLVLYGNEFNSQDPEFLEL